MSTGDSGLDYVYIPKVERLRRKVAIRVVVTLSAAGILIVLAGWLAS
ncbi:MAG TPA: hypothetical protein VNQ32_13850 [Steroidobacteraceae bacterium]|nr:hypothetical protein [Steroidobacteraceae bacterium]